MKDVLYYGDNLDVLPERVGTETVDLVYLDPPFNSNRNYNVIFARQAHKAADAAQIQAFEDTWHRNEVVWKRTSAHSSAKRYGPIHDTILFYSRSETFTWNPKPRKPEEAAGHDIMREADGRPYRLSDPTGAGVRHGETGKPWRGIEVTPRGRHWAYPPDVLDQLEADGRVVFNQKGAPRLKRYLDELPGIQVQDVWTDIDPINAAAKERLGYPTQKPLALLERIVEASSNPGDLVLEPFCGCGTTVDAAARLKRNWIGIDITYLAVDLIIKRLTHTFGDDFAKSFEVRGIPRDEEGATALFLRSTTEFERWAVSLVNGTPRGQTGDKGVDGVVRFFTDAKNATGRVIVSVKGGDSVGPQFVRDLLGTVETQKAELGLLVTRVPVTRGMNDAADHAGTYTWPVNGEQFPKVQLVTVGDLLAGKRPKLPPALMPYIQAPAHAAKAAQLVFGDEAG